jgi:predicted transcriptional regulator
MEARQYTAVTVDRGTKERVDSIAAAMNRSRSQVVRDAILAYEKTAKIKAALAAPAAPALEVRA